MRSIERNLGGAGCGAGRAVGPERRVTSAGAERNDERKGWPRQQMAAKCRSDEAWAMGCDGRCNGPEVSHAAGVTDGSKGLV